MKAPGPNVLSFLHGARERGFLRYAGDLWREHGDVFQVRMGSTTRLFAIHPDAVQQINVTNRKNYDKLASYDGIRQRLIGEGLVASRGELWRRQRRLMAPFYTSKGVMDYAELMLRDSVELAVRWQALEGAEVEMAEEMTAVTASIILKAMFSAGQLESTERMRKSIEDMISLANDGLTGLAAPLWMPTAKNRAYREARTYVLDTIDGLLARRRGLDEADWPDDLLTKLMRARDPETGEAMSETLLRDESITIFVAGHETTARTMTFAWYALAANPEVERRLHEELDTVLGGRQPTPEDLRRLPYTLQVVKEVLRLYPAAPFYVRDAVGADQLGDFEVKPGTSVMLSPYYTHRHPDFWPDPEAFDPERWTPEREAERHKFAYHPFAAGQRICLGNNFSLLETHLLLAVLAQRFSPKLREGYAPEWEMKGVLNLANGLPMRVVAR